jgi:hypothetical protein
MKSDIRILPVLAAAALIAGCGGGSSGAGRTQNVAPSLSNIDSQAINQDTPTAALAFTVSDDGGAEGVTVSATTSNATIVPADGIVIGGSGASRTLTVTPAEDATGQVSVTITATDAQGLATRVNVPIRVSAVQRSIASYTTTTFAQMENDDPLQVSGFTFTQDADDESTFAPLLQ